MDTIPFAKALVDFVSEGIHQMSKLGKAFVWLTVAFCVVLGISIDRFALPHEKPEPVRKVEPIKLEVSDVDARKQLSDARKELNATSKELGDTRKDLADTKEKLSAADAQIKSLSARLPPPGRHLSAEQRKIFVDALKGHKGSVAVRLAQAQEAQEYAWDIINAVKEAGWQWGTIVQAGSPDEKGISLAILSQENAGEPAENLARALVLSGVVSGRVGLYLRNGINNGWVELYVGTRE